MSAEEKPSEKKPIKYFDMSEAVDEIRFEAYGAKETTVAGLKFLGKGLCNAVKWTALEGLPKNIQLVKQYADKDDSYLKNKIEKGSFGEKVAASKVLRDRV